MFNEFNYNNRPTYNWQLPNVMQQYFGLKRCIIINKRCIMIFKKMYYNF